MERISNELVIIGDPFIDYYLDSNKICNGGVLNVLDNYKSIFDLSPRTFIPESPFLLNVFKNNTKINKNFFTTYYQPIKSKIKSNVCLISDYNRGTVNHKDLNIESNVVIVDSKHNSFNHNIVQNIPIKILRANKLSFDESISKFYDYVILSDNSEDISFRITSKKTSYSERILDVNMKCSVGAGDTMLATIGGVLNKYSEINEMEIFQSILFAKVTCADVVSRPYTSVSKTKYKEIKCILQNLMK